MYSVNLCHLIRCASEKINSVSPRRSLSLIIHNVLLWLADLCGDVYAAKNTCSCWCHGYIAGRTVVVHCPWMWVMWMKAWFVDPNLVSIYVMEFYWCWSLLLCEQKYLVLATKKNLNREINDNSLIIKPVWFSFLVNNKFQSVPCWKQLYDQDFF